MLQNTEACTLPHLNTPTSICTHRDCRLLYPSKPIVFARSFKSLNFLTEECAIKQRILTGSLGSLQWREQTGFVNMGSSDTSLLRSLIATAALSVQGVTKPSMLQP